MTLPRRVLPEILDELPAEDPRAVRSRRDLRRVNRLMGTHGILLRALDAAALANERDRHRREQVNKGDRHRVTEQVNKGDRHRVTPATRMRLVELGAGDGTMMLRLARSRSRNWPGAGVALLDRQPVVSADTLAAIRDLGWDVEVIAVDVFEWLARPSSADIVFANLFVHHFEGERLSRLLAGVAERSHAFLCCEPRRSRLALAGSHLLGLIGCNDVTRHDAVLSVHAGFRDDELSSLWPRDRRWQLQEAAAGLFSHVFTARRIER